MTSARVETRMRPGLARVAHSGIRGADVVKAERVSRSPPETGPTVPKRETTRNAHERPTSLLRGVGPQLTLGHRIIFSMEELDRWVDTKKCWNPWWKKGALLVLTFASFTQERIQHHQTALEREV
jgi:hypothetical protein